MSLPPKIFVLRIVLSIHLLAFASITSADQNFSDSKSTFTNPQFVKIFGLPLGAKGTYISTEEPFISRDGRFLFFNSGKNENNKDLHFAELVDNNWIYRGLMGPNVNNSKEVQANPTMDRNNNFLYIDTESKSMVRVASFSPVDGELRSIRDIEVIPGKKVDFIGQKVYGNIGIEISADGSYAFFSRATWELKIGLEGFTIGKLLGSDIQFARKHGSEYIFDSAETKRILRQINTLDMEYASSISSDGLELFFTRFAITDYRAGKIRSRIMRSTRASLSEPFSKPEIVSAIGYSDFVEGPSISGDGLELYYHKFDGTKFRIYKVSRDTGRR